ncbi:Major Facilitator Superfamily protein [Paractinoplanes atraurantiacus]|uniref:Major Facilitator Superfamily protein n=2 Tax=Paractinoplanes atraurantiacus TaxID=1036182 RepID=A0A285JN41_9ACTN|nr:Major Facilitator Superfamily protein [Actinoplanes atraurantiacus]
MFVIGLVLFSFASLLVGLAPHDWWLIAARALQGVGAAILAASSLSLLTANFAEGRERAKAVAAYSAVAGIGASAGLVVGGVLADLVSWRAGFFLNVPIGIAMIVAARRFIGETERHRGRFDLVGALSATLGMTALVFGIIEKSLGAVALGVVLLAVLVVNEARAEQPIMPLRLFADRRRTGAYLVRMLYLGAMIGFFFYTSQYLRGVLGFSPLQAGLAFLPMSAVNFGVATLVNRFKPVPALIAGVAITLAGMNTFHQLGGALGLAVLTALAGSRIGPALTTGSACSRAPWWSSS